MAQAGHAHRAPRSVFHRVLHAHASPADLRSLLNREWATLSVVAGLFVLLHGAGATSSIAESPGADTSANAGYNVSGLRMIALVSQQVVLVTGCFASLCNAFALAEAVLCHTRPLLPQVVRYLYLSANIIAYMTSVTSCISSLIFLHTSNAVAAGELHAYLHSAHAYLWLPHATLAVAVVATAVTNSCATLFIYNSWAAFITRLTISIVWLLVVSLVLRELAKKAAAHEVRPEP